MSDGPVFPPDAHNPSRATEDFPGDQGGSLALPDAAFWTRHGGGDSVRFAVAGGVGHVVLDRPHALNAITADLVDDLMAQLLDWRDDDTVGAVSLRGAGTRAFSAGADVRAVRDLVLAGDPVAAGDFWAREYALIGLVGSYPKPVSVLMDGVIMGGGLGLAAVAQDRRITPDARLAMPETKIGFFTDAGSSRLFARAPGELGTYLALTGATFWAADALALGFADRLVWSIEADTPAQPTATAAVPPPAAPAADVSAPLLAEREWIDECFAGDDPHEIMERLRRHTAPAARACAATIGTRSPQAVCASLARVRAAATEPDLACTLAADTMLARELTVSADFVEGVRALLIDKDTMPRWTSPPL